jgi:hypothetical protein
MSFCSFQSCGSVKYKKCQKINEQHLSIHTTPLDNAKLTSLHSGTAAVGYIPNHKEGKITQI